MCEGKKVGEITEIEGKEFKARDLASMVGYPRDVVSRALTKLINDGKVTKRGNKAGTTYIFLGVD